MEYLDDMFSQFAEAFVGNMEGQGDIPLRHRLNTQTLDYSPGSLKEVDDYLGVLYKERLENSGAAYQNVVVWCGAYTGEVIRRNAVVEYHWVDYKEYMHGKDDSVKKLIPYTLATHALLAAAGQGYFTMPMNKVARFLEEGPENNIAYYASADIARKNEGTDINLKTANTDDKPNKPWWKRR